MNMNQCEIKKPKLIREILWPVIGILAGLAICSLALFCGGCTTTTTVTNGVTNSVTSFDIVKATNAINAALPPVVRLVVAKYPVARPYLTDAAVVFNLVASGADLSPDALNAALKSFGLTALDNPDVQAAIDSAVALYKAYYGDVVTTQLNKVQYLVPILQSIGGAITAGLNTQ